MIKVIAGYKLKDVSDVSKIKSMVLKLRSSAMTYDGFVKSETLLGDPDSSIVAVETTWDNIQNWREWEGSAIRKAILQEVQSLLAEETRVTIYRIMPTEKWTWD
jgi:antibiotic biosynthesis monooxygenase (ABM) superfamily enzyme